MYSIQIEKLEFIINNWDGIKRECTLVSDKFFDKFKCNIMFKDGLCQNCSLNRMELTVRHTMFKKFSVFSGSYAYPLGEKEFFNFRNFANNPNRLLLAKHCIDYLKNNQ